jgi:hypothetical protein
MPLKNYRSRLTTDPFAVIQKTLAQHRAKQIIQEFGDDGRVHAISFSLEINGKLHAFRLPARVESVERIFYGDRGLTETQREQAYKTACANIRDWITAQMALLDNGMVKPRKFFSPTCWLKTVLLYFKTCKHAAFYFPLDNHNILLPTLPITSFVSFAGELTRRETG